MTVYRRRKIQLMPFPAERPGDFIDLVNTPGSSNNAIPEGGNLHYWCVGCGKSNRAFIPGVSFNRENAVGPSE
jgi:hypothetical protein